MNEGKSVIDMALIKVTLLALMVIEENEIQFSPTKIKYIYLILL
jgi:hypothetical protein